MDESKKMTELIERKNDLLFLINWHAQNREPIWGNDNEGYEDYVNAALDELNEINEAIKDITGENFNT